MTDDEVDALLTTEERAESEALLQGLEDGTVVSVMTPAERERHRAIAQHTLDVLAQQEARKKTNKAKAIRTVHLRMTLEDVEALQTRASALGMGYQTLLKSSVQQYLTGQLVSGTS